jgi:hypothetical protein
MTMVLEKAMINCWGDDLVHGFGKDEIIKDGADHVSNEVPQKGEQMNRPIADRFNSPLSMGVFRHSPEQPIAAPTMPFRAPR